jgi:hypothetical protein
MELLAGDHQRAARRCGLADTGAVPSLDAVFEELRGCSKVVPSPRPLPSERDLREAEERLGILLPSDLRRYLLEASDVVCGHKEPVTIGTDDSTDLTTVVADAREVGVPSDLIPVCEDNGDFYCLTPSGEVIFWSHNGTTDERWPDLATWIHEVWIHGR